jgi:hypothetical protein
VPIVDMAFAFVRRTANRTGFATPDKSHLHHRLLRLGHGHRRSVLILWAWTVLLSGFILFPLYISSVNAIIPFGVLALGVVLYTLFHPSLRRQTEPGPEGEAPLDPPAGPGEDGSARSGEDGSARSGAGPGPPSEVGAGAGPGADGRPAPASSPATPPVPAATAGPPAEL